MERVKLFELKHNNMLMAFLAVQIPLGTRSDERRLHKQLFVDDVAYIVVKGREVSSTPASWGDEAMSFAHRYIAKRWGALESGDVIDMDEETKVQTLFEEPHP